MAGNTVDRWIRTYRCGGFEALAPAPLRNCEPATPAAMLALAEALKREVPRRTAAQVGQIIRTAEGWAPSERTLQRLFVRLGLNTRVDGAPPRAFGRFEADASNDLWTGDPLHGPAVGGRKTYLFAFIDDHSRALVGYRWVARIAWCVEERALGVITGEVGAGKTVAVRAAVAVLDTSRFTTLYFGNPSVGARGLYYAIVSGLGGVPRFHKAALIPQAADALAAEEAERGKRVVLIVDLCRRCDYADSGGDAGEEALQGRAVKPVADGWWSA